MWARFSPKFFSFLLIQFALTCFVFQVRADDDDPPTRVARLAYAQGSVSFQPAGTNNWIGDKIWSDNDGRAELQQQHTQEQKQLEQKQQQERQGQEKAKKPEHPPAQQP